MRPEVRGPWDPHPQVHGLAHSELRIVGGHEEHALIHAVLLEHVHVGAQGLFPDGQGAAHIGGVAVQHGAEEVRPGDSHRDAHAGVEADAPGRVTDEYDPAAMPGVHPCLLDRVEQQVLGGVQPVEHLAQQAAGGLGTPRVRAGPVTP